MTALRSKKLLKPGHLIRRNHQRAVALFAEEAGPLDVTPPIYQVLATLEEKPGLDQITLSSLAAIDKSSIAELIGRLENRGLIKREKGADQRTKVIFLTPAGSELLVRIEPAVQRAQARIIMPLTASERTTLQKLLRKLIAE